METDLTDRQMAFLIRAHKIAPNKDDRFYVEEMGRAFGWKDDQSLDVFHTLTIPPDLVCLAIRHKPATTGGYSEPIPETNGLTPGRLSTRGRVVSLHLLDERKSKRQAWIVKCLLGVWGITLTASIPLLTNYFSHRIDRLENASTKPVEK